MPDAGLIGLGLQAGAVLPDAENHAGHDGDHGAQHGDKPDYRFDPVTPAPKRIPVQSEPSGEPGEWIL
ncbi:hypothetical protein GCM10023194_41450 [Planotetraspora phitsanulokensis]|uniref:Uncharacterized protein n=1 Tax=Planotetraspora phitsanulokensis TaxID=575192 RepID=A0A8J3XGI5_9ACTN|nr:hypothetical protein Pph01_58700 [Planotetraspora phitsanulokensis]